MDDMSNSSLKLSIRDCSAVTVVSPSTQSIGNIDKSTKENTAKISSTTEPDDIKIEIVEETPFVALSPARNETDKIQESVCLVESNVCKCIARGCTYSNEKNINKVSSTISFVPLPKNDTRRKHWLNLIDRKDLIPQGKSKYKNFMLCSFHFPDHMWYCTRNGKALKEDAFPFYHSFDDDDPPAKLQCVGSPSKPTPKLKPIVLKGLKVKSMASLLAKPSPTKEAKIQETPLNLEVQTLPTQLLKNQQNYFLLPVCAPNQAHSLLYGTPVTPVVSCLPVQKGHSCHLHQKTGVKPIEKQEVIEELQRNSSNSNENNPKQSISTQRTHMENDHSSEHSQTVVSDRETLGDTSVSEENISEQPHKNAQNLGELKTNLSYQKELYNVKEKLFAKEIEYRQVIYQNAKLQEKLEDMQNEMMELNKLKTEEGLRKLVLNFAENHLNQAQGAWLQAQFMSKDEREKDKYPPHYKELCIYLLSTSSSVYSLIKKAFGLPEISIVEKWMSHPLSDIEYNGNMINSLFEEVKPIERKHIPNINSEYFVEGEILEQESDLLNGAFEDGQAYDEGAFIEISDSDSSSGLE